MDKMGRTKGWVNNPIVHRGLIHPRHQQYLQTSMSLKEADLKLIQNDKPPSNYPMFKLLGGLKGGKELQVGVFGTPLRSYYQVLLPKGRYEDDGMNHGGNVAQYMLELVVMFEHLTD